MLDAKPPLDIAKLKKSLWDDQNIFIEIAQAMRSDISNRGAQLNEAYHVRDAMVTKHEAHALKGGLASVTAAIAASLAGDMEKMALAGQWDGFDVKLRLFQEEIQRVDVLLEQELANLA